MNVKISSRFILIIILASFLLAACGGSPAQPIAAAVPTIAPALISPTEPQQGDAPLLLISDFPYADPSTVFTSGDSEMGMGVPETLPNGLPKDVPIIPGHIMNWITSKAAGHPTPTYNISIVTSTDNASAVAWYKSEMEAGGWKIESEKDNSGIPAKAGEAQKTVEIESKNGNRSLNVSFFITEGTPFGTSIELVYWEGN